MPSIIIKRRDVVWNYIGTLFSMVSGFLLLPMLLAFLADDELGLWYSFVAISNLTLLFEFGFNPTFARNIVYCISGAKSINKTGMNVPSSDRTVDYHLLKTLFRTTKAVFALIAIIAITLVLTIGSYYIYYITDGGMVDGTWVAWLIFCVAIFINLYFYYTVTFLRGLGDVAGENRARTFAKIGQLIITMLLLFAGFGIVGAAIGYLGNGLLLRLFANASFKKHAYVVDGLKRDSEPVTRAELVEVFKSISYIAWRDGLVQLALFLSTQGTTILSSLFLGLAETGTYSVMFQFGHASCQLAGAYARSYYPAFQSSFSKGEIEDQREYVSEGLVMHFFSWIIITIVLCFFVLPLLPLIKPSFVVDYNLYFALGLYLFLMNQHSICCNYIISMNEIPYVIAYIVAAVLGVLFSGLLMGLHDMGVWGLVFGQAASQLVYNNWKWPKYILTKLELKFAIAIRMGVKGLWHKAGMILKKTVHREC